MANPLDHFGLFFLKVWAHAITLAAGCVVTVLVGLWEKYRKKPVPWKVEVGILLSFVLFSCFQAWHDEYTRAEVLTTKCKPSTPTFRHLTPEQEASLMKVWMTVHVSCETHNDEACNYATQIRLVFNRFRETGNPHDPWNNISGNGFLWPYPKQLPPHAGALNYLLWAGDAAHEGNELDAVRLLSNAKVDVRTEIDSSLPEGVFLLVIGGQQ